MRSEGQNSRADYLELMQVDLEKAQAQNAELHGALNRCVNEMQGGDYSEVGYSAVEQADIALSKTPTQSLAEIEARAVEKFKHWYKDNHGIASGQVKFAAEKFCKELRQQAGR